MRKGGVENYGNEKRTLGHDSESGHRGGFGCGRSVGR